MNIALIGVGLMGYPMGVRLCAAGHRVVAWNRTRAKAERLEAAGARVADSPREAVDDAELVLLVLEHGDAVQRILFDEGTASALAKGALVVDMSSIRPAEAQSHAAALSVAGIGHLDAPVSGGTVGASDGTLAIMVGGRAEDVVRARPVLEALGRVVHVGSHGTGQLAKLANQMIVGITIGAVAEALLFAQQGGADMAKVREAIRGGFAESRVLEVHGQRMVDRDFVKRAGVSVQLKDLRNALVTAGQMGRALPIAQGLAALYEQTVDGGWGELDHSAVMLALEEGAGGRW